MTPSADQKAPVAAPLDRKFVRTGVFLVDQPFGRGDEILVRLGPVELDGRLVPILAVFAAAADVGHRVGSPHIHPLDGRHLEARSDGDVEAAVTVQQRGVVAG
jgi:hypothetical protein